MKSDAGESLENHNLVWHRIFLFLSLMLVAGTSLFKTRGNDIWWHIRTGQWIWEQGALPTTDPFSHTFAGSPWHYTDWIAQLFFYGLDQLGGAPALVWGKAGLVLLAMGLLAWAIGVWRSKESLGPAVMVLCLAAIAMHFRLVLKPVLFSFVIFIVLFGLIRRVGRGSDKKLLLLIPPIVLAWANLHRGAPLALAVLLAALVGFSLRREQRRLAVWVAGVALVSTGALLVNPGGRYLLESVFRESVTQVQATADWAPLSLDLPWLSIPAFLGMLLFWAAGWAIRRRRLDFEALVVAGCVVLSFKAVRFIPYAAIAMVPGLAEDLRIGMGKLADRLSLYVRAGMWHALMISVGAGLLIASYLTTYPPAVRGSGMARWLLPADAAEFLAEHPPPGPMWNPLDLSGFLLYRLSPGIKVFVDGRSDTLYPREFFKRTLDAHHQESVLLEQLQKFKIGFAVLDVRRTWQVSKHSVFQHPDWILVYWDDLCAIMVRKTPASQSYLDRLGYSQLRIGTAVDRLSNLNGDPHAAGLTRDVLSNLERAPDSIWAHVLAMQVFRANGDEASYMRQLATIKRLSAARSVQIEFDREP